LAELQNNYLIKPFLELVNVTGELEGLELQLPHALDDQKVEDLLGDEISQVSDNQLVVSINPLPQLVYQWILSGLLVFLFAHRLAEVSNKIADIVGIKVEKLALEK